MRNACMHIRFCLAAMLYNICCSTITDMCLMIIQGTLFPMCGMNLAFNRELIGPAMYFGLMGEGYPIGRYDDMWAGWCVKVVSSMPCCNNSILTCQFLTCFGIGRKPNKQMALLFGHQVIKCHNHKYKQGLNRSGFCVVQLLCKICADRLKSQNDYFSMT